MIDSQVFVDLERVLIDTLCDCFGRWTTIARSEEHTSELQSLRHLVCRLLLDKRESALRCTAAGARKTHDPVGMKSEDQRAPTDHQEHSQSTAATQAAPPRRRLMRDMLRPSAR